VEREKKRKKKVVKKTRESVGSSAELRPYRGQEKRKKENPTC
jgi:hypothetical protein